jgi:hypothetical protein
MAKFTPEDLNKAMEFASRGDASWEALAQLLADERESCARECDGRGWTFVYKDRAAVQEMYGNVWKVHYPQGALAESYHLTLIGAMRRAMDLVEGK